jgi:hypothetical protein
MRGHDHVPRPDLAGGVLDDELGAVGAHVGDAAAGADAVAQPARQGLGERAGAAEQMVGDQRPLAAPDEREEADAAAGRELVQLCGRPVRGAGEDRLDARRHRSEELGERAVVLEREHARAHVGGRLARRDRRELGAAGDRAPEPQPHRGERRALAQRERQAEGVGLRPPVVHQPRAHGEAHHAAAERHGLEPALARHRAHERARGGEEVGTVVHPVCAPRLGAQAPARPVAGLEQDEVAVAEPPGGREPGDAAAHDDHLATLHARTMSRPPSTR